MGPHPGPAGTVDTVRATLPSGERPPRPGRGLPPSDAQQGRSSSHARRLRVLISGVNYWPEATGIAPYTTGLAQHLAGEGHQVTVLTGVPHYPAWVAAEGYPRDRFVARVEGGVRVVRGPLYVPRQPSAMRRAMYEASFLVHLARLGRLERPDVVIGVLPSLSGGVLARLLARRFGSPYGLIFQDLIGPAMIQSGIDGGRRRILGANARRLEAWVARGATRVGVITPTFRPYLTGLGVAAERIVDVPNWTHVTASPEEPAKVRQRMGWRGDEFVALHAGSMGFKQALDQVLEAARMVEARGPTEGGTLRFVLMGDGSQRSRLEAMADGSTNVTFLPLQPEDTFMSTLAAADALLISERESVRTMSLPSKLTSYLAAGRPIVAAVAPGGATENAVVDSGAGLTAPANEPAAMVRALDRLRTEPRLAARLGARGRRLALRELGQASALTRLESLVLESSEEAWSPGRATA